MNTPLDTPRTILSSIAFIFYLSCVVLYSGSSASEPTGHDATVASAGTASAPGKPRPDNGAASTVTTASIPPMLLLYKYAPNAFNDDFLLKRTKRQVGQDQVYYKYGDRSHVFVFSRDQIEGRVVDFAAKELLPTYKKRLSELARGIPKKLTIIKKLNLSYLEYADGMLRGNSSSGQGPTVIDRPYMLDKNAKLKLPPLGSREVLRLPQLQGNVAASEFPISVTESAPPGHFYLALDRAPIIPPLAMEPAAAEKMWKPPECPTARGYGTMRDSAREKALMQCRAKMAQYRSGLGPAVKAVFQIATEGVKVDGTDWVVKARLLGVQLFGPHGRLLHTFASSDFPTGDDVWQAQSDALAAQQRAHAGAGAQAEAKQLAAEQMRIKARKALHNADVVGIRLGMTVAEAEKIIRRNMDVEWVARSPDKAPPYLQQNRPYNYFKTFISSDSGEQITVFWHSEISDRIVAITRVLPLPEGASPEAAVTQLLDKYGNQPVEKNDFSIVWTVDFGVQKPTNVADIDNASRFRNGTCVAQLGDFPIGAMQIIEGQALDQLDPVTRNAMAYTAGIRVLGGRLPGKHGGFSNKWDPTQWQACGPMVLSSIRSDHGQAAYIRIGILDLATYASSYAKIVKSTTSADVELNL